MNVRLAMAVAALVCGGCRSNAAAPVAAAPPLSAAAEQGRPAAPAGERFAVKLDTMVSTPFSTAGEPFSAELVTPIVATDGQILIPAGARITGTVDRIDLDPHRPKLRLAFDPVVVSKGVAPLEVSIVHAQAVEVPPSTTTTIEDRKVAVTSRPAAVLLPRGSQLDLELTEPLVPVPSSCPAGSGAAKTRT